MKAAWRWLRTTLSFIMLWAWAWLALNHELAQYLLQQGKGQAAVLFSTHSLYEYQNNLNQGSREWGNIDLVEKIKSYAVDSLGYKPSNSYRKIFVQGENTTLWVITASKPYTLEPYEWQFPLVGRVSYKGFFEKNRAVAEYNHLRVQGYDVDLRSVSAWSTLGWFNDPLLSSMLQRSRAGFCELLFHELFHATCYLPSSVDLNENMASFVARKATLRFLAADTQAVQHYLEAAEDEKKYNDFMFRQCEKLNRYYRFSEGKPARFEGKLLLMKQIADSISKLSLHNAKPYAARGSDIIRSKNAFFVDLRQYDSLQDSLEAAFNKNYKGNLKKLVHDLRQHQINY